MIVFFVLCFVAEFCVMDVVFGILVLNIVQELLENVTLCSTDLVLGLCNWIFINIVFWK